MTLLYLAIIIWLLPLLTFIIQIFFGNRLPRKGDWVVVGAMFIDLALALVIFGNVIYKYNPDFRAVLQFDWISLGGQDFPLGFVLDNVTAVMLVVVTLVSALIFLYSIGYMKGDPLYSRYFAYLSFFAFSMLGVVLFENLFGIYICWELVGLSSYLLIGFWFEKDSASDAGKKAFITNRVGDFGMFLGMLIVFSALGTFSLEGIKNGVESGQLSGTLLTAAGILFFMGAVGKSAQFPLHVWLPDAMEGPTPVSALIHAATMVAAGVYLIVRIVFMLTPVSTVVIAYIGGFTAFFAATIALTQNDIKRILAYSTVSQLGYMMLALGTGSYAAGLFHLMTHAFFKALLFLGSGSIIYAMHHALHAVNNDADPQNINNMGGLRRKMKVTFWTYLVATLAISGVPFTSGFISKDAILAGTLSFAGRYPQHFLLPFFGFAAAGITAFYMFRLVFKTFFGEFKISEAREHIHESGKIMTVPLVGFAVFCFFAFYTAGNNSISLSSPGEGWFYDLIKPPEQTAMTAAEMPFSEEIYEQEELPAEPGASHSYAIFLSLLIVGAGIVVSYRTYISKTISAETWAAMYPRLYRGMYNKWYIDEFYHATVIKLIFVWSALCRWFDNVIIDGIVNGSARITVIFSWFEGKFDNIVIDGIVNGIANATQILGWFTRQFQTGRIQNYLVGFLIGIFVIIIFRMM
ncbi:NADH-quinone oxidoreductase subunit L [bacterium SM23_31]|nr:MAG: NADH-quinone oxidoreductase subunit L [bacterium SM23_31]